MNKTVYTENVLDASTGEVVSRKWISKSAKSTDHFIKMYLEDISALSKLTNAEHRLLIALANFLEFNTNQFFLNKERREQLCQEIGIKSSTFNVSISRLVKKNLLIKVSSFTYQMNPKIFFNGEEIARAQILEVVLRYNICEDC